MGVREIYESMSYGPAPESADLAYEWLDSHGRSFGLFIDGQFADAASGQRFQTLNPATAEPLAEVSQAGAQDVDRAVSASERARGDWLALGGYGRAKVLYALARQVQKHSRLFAVLESLDNGKPIRETRDIDIPLVARHFYYHAGWAESVERDFPGMKPVGVCGQIIPWNFPLLMLAWKIAPALAWGNTVVLKPAEYTPLTALLFAEICRRAGVPSGVVNIVTGDGETGKLIVDHPGVHKIAFTGSTEVGRAIRVATSGTTKKLSLELGGKSPFVVFEDADLDSAVEGLVDAIWFNQGQVCCAGSRLLVQESIEKKLHAKLKERMEKLRVGNPLDKAVDIGAIIAPVQLERISALVDEGARDGADLFQPTWTCPKEGWFYPPTLLSNVGPASRVAQEEIFGPVLVSMSFRTPKEAVELANNTVYGLAASVWSESLGRALDVSARIKAGTVWVNCTNLFDGSVGFGGYRESGFGREGGIEGLMEYAVETLSPAVDTSPGARRERSGLDRTHKQYIGGKQARPDSGYSRAIGDEDAPRGNRKDVRNAVEAARAAQGAWSATPAHGRAQILYYVAENLLASVGPDRPDQEKEEAARAAFRFAGRADKFEGRVHEPPLRGVVYSRYEPIGVIAIVCPDELPLAALVGSVSAAVAMGNAVVVVPSEADPLPAEDLIHVLESSDIPAGVVNIVAGLRPELVETLARHDDVDAIWCFSGDAERVRRLSASNLKQTWTPEPFDWQSAFELPDIFLRHATQVKNVWVPYGD